MFFGNLFVAIMFQGKERIDSDTRLIVFSVLTGVAVVGILFLLLLRAAEAPDGELIAKGYSSPVEALKRAFVLLFTKEMALLCATFFYTGIYKCYYCYT